MKYKNYLLSIILLCSSHYCSLIASDNDLTWHIENDLFDDFNPELSRMADEAPDATITRGTKKDSLEMLTAQNVKAQEILQDPLYYRTNPAGRRNIIDLPIFQSFSTFAPLTKVSCLPFYTQTYKEYYFKEYDAIKYYIDMNQKHLIRLLDDFQFTTFNIPQVLSLFENIKIQERRLGFMFNVCKNTDRWLFSVRTPLYYTEHNLYLSKSEQRVIADYPLFKELEGNPIQFALEHLVADRLGIGDTRINAEYLVKATNRYQLSLGAKATIPTAFRISKGVLGSYFDVKKKAPQLDLHADLLDIFLTDEELVKENGANFAIDAIDRLSTILLQQGTGNNHHLGLGLFSHSTLYFKDHVYLSSLASAEVLLPAHEQRFFIIKNDQAAFDAFNWADDNAQVSEKIDFLNTQLREKFFPPGYETTVFPGFIFQSTSALTYEVKNWDLTLGADFWWHTKEHFLTIDAPEDMQALLQKETAKRSHMYQTGIWLAAERHPFENSEWQFGLRLGKTGLSSGIGQDVSFAFHVENFF